jgi:hypothetical protein
VGGPRETDSWPEAVAVAVAVVCRLSTLLTCADWCSHQATCTYCVRRGHEAEMQSSSNPQVSLYPSRPQNTAGVATYVSTPAWGASIGSGPTAGELQISQADPEIGECRRSSLDLDALEFFSPSPGPACAASGDLRSAPRSSLLGATVVISRQQQ